MFTRDATAPGWTTDRRPRRWLDGGRAFTLDERARRLAACLPRRARRRGDRTADEVRGRRRSTSWRSTTPAAGSTSSPRRQRRPNGTSIARSSTAAARRARHAGGRSTAAHAYDISPGRTLGVPHLFAASTCRRAIDLVSLPDHTRRCARWPTTRRCASKLAPLLDAADRVLHGRRRRRRRRSTAGCIKPARFDPSKTLSGDRLRLRRAGRRRRCVDRWGGARGALPPRARQRGLSRRRASTTAARRRRKGAAWRKVRLRHGRRSVVEGAGRGGARARARRIRSSTAIASAIWGWSGGGSNTLNAMFRYPDVYKVGVSVAPVPDQRLYDTIYQERYMGLPQDNAEGYRVGSPINFAEGLQGQAARSSTAPATTTCTTRAPSGWSTGSSSSASRSI